MTKTLILKASESQPQCTSPAATILGEIRSIIVPYPSPLFLTSTWKDSLSTATCSSAQVPTLLESVSSYQVTGKATNRLSQALVIQRVDSTHFAGHGTQNQHELEVTGIGVTLSSIYLDINTGTITLVDTHEKTNIIIRVSGQERRFIQEVRQRVDLLP
jgi:acetylglutamate synthase